MNFSDFYGINFPYGLPLVGCLVSNEASAVTHQYLVINATLWQAMAHPVFWKLLITMECRLVTVGGLVMKERDIVSHVLVIRESNLVMFAIKELIGVTTGFYEIENTVFWQALTW